MLGTHRSALHWVIMMGRSEDFLSNIKRKNITKISDPEHEIINP